MERRFATDLTARGRKLAGYAAIFNTEARISDFVELIRPGAFGSLTGKDILALADHDPGKVLARTKSGTLRLAEDDRGLRFELDVPDTQAGRDVLALAERGDLGGMSFGFLVPKGGDHWTGKRRELVKVDLREISVVSAWPAYPETTVNARSTAGPFHPKLNLAVKYLETLS